MNIGIRLSTRLLLLAILASLCSIGSAQKKNFTIQGYVYDKNFHTPLLGGMTYLLDESGSVIDSCKVGQTGLWSNEQRKFIKQPNWMFYVERKPVKYTVEITMPKYEPLYLQIDLSGIGHRQNEYMAPEAYMAKSAIKLKDVVVTATKVKFYNKGDTLVYNADAFQLAEGSMLDALIDQLPGVELKEGGRIYVNGKFVENLTLNGRDFFGGNHQLLLENLGAYTVKDIAVYDKLGEKSEFYGREIPGDKQFTMDVRLKKEYQESWMLNAEGGGGTHDRYMGRLFVARNTSHSTLGLFANFNNLSDQGRPGQNTLWKQAVKTGGEQRVQHAGLTYSIDGSRTGVKNNGDIIFARIFNNLTSNTMRTNLLPRNTTYDYSYATAHGDALSLRQSHRLQMKKKYWMGDITERVSYTKNNDSQSTAAALFDTELHDLNRQTIEDIYTSGTAEWKQSLVNRTLCDDLTRSHTLNAYLNLSSDFKFEKSPDALWFGVTGKYNNSKNRRFNRYQINYGQEATPAFNLNNYYNSPSDSYSARAYAGYIYRFVGDGYIQVNYAFEHSERNSDRMRYRLDRLEQQGVFGTVPSGYAQTIDPLNSHTAHYNTNAHNAVLVLALPPFADNMDICLRSTFDYDMKSLSYVRNSTDYRVRKNFFLLGFDDMFNYIRLRLGKYKGAYGSSYRHTLKLTYDLKSRAPELMDLVPVTDDSDPLNIYVGASSLKPEHLHKVKLEWAYRPKRANINNTLRLAYEATTNALTHGYDYYAATGVRTWRTYNTDGNWTRYATNTFSLVFGGKRQFTLSSDSRVENSQAADVIGTAERPAAQFAVKNWLLSEGLRLTWQIGKQQIGINGSAVWRNTCSDSDDFASFHATNLNCGLTGQFKLPGGVGLSTDLTLYSRSGYADSRLNTNDIVWNARLSYAFGKGRWVAMLDGFDLLHQLSNVTYGITAQARTITYTNTLPRYCLLHLQYKLNITPMKKGRK